MRSHRCWWNPLKISIKNYSDIIMGMMASHITSLRIVSSIVYSGADQRKHQKLHVTGLCGGNSPVTGEFPAQMASNVETLSIWWCHLDVCITRHMFDRTWKFLADAGWLEVIIPVIWFGNISVIILVPSVHGNLGSISLTFNRLQHQLQLIWLAYIRLHFNCPLQNIYYAIATVIVLLVFPIMK